MDLKQAVGRLQDELATTDLLTRRSSKSVVKFLIKRHQNIRLRMDGNLNHARPHIHIDYGNEYHTASYAIDDGTRLAGALANKYDKQVMSWIASNREQLLQAWEITQSGHKPEVIVAELKASSFA